MYTTRRTQRGGVGEAPAGEPLVAVTVTEDEKSRGAGTRREGDHHPSYFSYLPPLSYLPFPPYHPLSKVSLLFS